jgi:hypothetical protein
LEAVAAFEDVEEEALVWLVEDERGAAGAALEQAFAVADVELRKGLGGAVAALAVADEDGLDLLKEEFFAGLGGEGEGEADKRQEAKHGAIPGLPLYQRKKE